jgi:hypothetical protein
MVRFLVLDVPYELSQRLPIQLALPDHKNTVTAFIERLLVTLVAFGVALELLAPEIDIAGGHDRKGATRMLVPETPVDEHHSPIPG